MMMHPVDTFNPNTDHPDEIEQAIIFRTHFWSEGNCRAPEASS